MVLYFLCYIILEYRIYIYIRVVSHTLIIFYSYVHVVWHECASACVHAHVLWCECICVCVCTWYICIMNSYIHSERWITRLVDRWRAQPAALLNANCRHIEHRSPERTLRHWDSHPSATSVWGLQFKMQPMCALVYIHVLCFHMPYFIYVRVSVSDVFVLF